MNEWMTLNQSKRTETNTLGVATLETIERDRLAGGGLTRLGPVLLECHNGASENDSTNGTRLLRLFLKKSFFFEEDINIIIMFNTVHV